MAKGKKPSGREAKPRRRVYDIQEGALSDDEVEKFHAARGQSRALPMHTTQLRSVLDDDEDEVIGPYAHFLNHPTQRFKQVSICPMKWTTWKKTKTKHWRQQPRERAKRTCRMRGERRKVFTTGSLTASPLLSFLPHLIRESALIRSTPTTKTKTCNSKRARQFASNRFESRFSFPKSHL